jgi:DNA-binding SARP family transcriptional activator
LDEDLCRVDTRQFRALAKEGKEKEKRGDLKEALDCFTRAAELYQGDFIPEERYDPWTERQRQDLKNIYIDILTHSGRFHEQSGAFKKAVACLKQVIETDPLFEEAYRSLMTLYAEKKLFNEALRVFEACRKALKEELDTAPDPATMALYQGIKERTHKS